MRQMLPLYLLITGPATTVPVGRAVQAADVSGAAPHDLWELPANHAILVALRQHGATASGHAYTLHTRQNLGVGAVLPPQKPYDRYLVQSLVTTIPKCHVESGRCEPQ